MAELSKEQLSQAIERAMSDITQEVKVFGVTDLRAQVTELGKIGAGAAWTISYSTKSANIENIADVAKVGGLAAWTISYSTKSVGIEQVTKEQIGR